MTELLGLFLVSFLSATILPGSSEVAFGGLVASGGHVLGLWIAATTGNTLGAVLNWALARYFLRFQDRAWFPFQEDGLGRAQDWFQRYGSWCLLLAWLPVIGDGLTFVAGLMRVRIGLFVGLVAIGKGARYAALAWLIERASES